MKAMMYIKQMACPDLSIKEFREEWDKLTPAEQEELKQMAREQGSYLGDEVE